MGGCQRADLELGCRIGASSFSSREKGAAGPEMGVNKCSVMGIGKFDRGYGEKENSNGLRHSTICFGSA